MRFSSWMSLHLAFFLIWTHLGISEALHAEARNLSPVSLFQSQDVESQEELKQAKTILGHSERINEVKKSLKGPEIVTKVLYIQKNSSYEKSYLTSLKMSFIILFVGIVLFLVIVAFNPSIMILFHTIIGLIGPIYFFLPAILLLSSSFIMLFLVLWSFIVLFETLLDIWYVFMRALGKRSVVRENVKAVPSLLSEKTLNWIEDRPFSTRSFYQKFQDWNKAGLNWLEVRMPAILESYNLKLKDYQSWSAEASIALKNRIGIFQKSLEEDGNRILDLHSEESKRFISEKEDRVVYKILNTFYKDLLQSLSQEETVSPIVIQSLTERKKLLRRQLHHEMNLMTQQHFYEDGTSKSTSNGYEYSIEPLNNIPSHLSHSPDLPNFCRRKMKQENSKEKALELYTSGTLSAYQLNANFLKNVLSPQELSLHLDSFQRILDKDFIRKLELSEWDVDARKSVKSKFNEMTKNLKEGKWQNITNQEYKEVATLMLELASMNRTWGLLQKMATAEHREGDSKTMDIKLYSTSLLSPDELRNKPLGDGRTNEKEMLAIEMKMFKAFDGKEFQFTEQGETIRFKADITGSIWSVNFFRNKLTFLTKLWDVAKPHNAIAIEKILKRSEDRQKELEDQIKQAEKGSDAQIELNINLIELKEISGHLKRTWDQKLYRKKTFDPYVMPKLFLHVSRLLEGTLYAHCKSGKDRTAQLWTEMNVQFQKAHLAREAWRSHLKQTKGEKQGFEAPFYSYNKALNSEEVVEMYNVNSHNGNRYNQYTNTGFVGSKIKKDQTDLRERYGNYFENVRGFSGGVRSMYAPGVEKAAWDGQMQKYLSDVLPRDQYEPLYRSFEAAIRANGVKDDVAVQTILDAIVVVKGNQLRGAILEDGIIRIANTDVDQYLKASQNVSLEKGAREWLAYALVGHEVAHKQFKPEKLLGVFNISSFGVLGFNKPGTDLLATHFDELPADVQEWMEEAYVVATALSAQGWLLQEDIGAFLDLKADDVVGSKKTNKHRNVMRVIKNLLKQGDVKPKDALTHMLRGLKAEDKLTPSLNNLATKLNISA